jgi:hypothetical protein
MTAQEHLPVGRKPWFIRWPKKLQALLEALSNGHSQRTACDLAGIPTSCFYQAMAKADVLIEACESNGHVPSARDAKYMQFSERVRAAESVPIDKNIKMIQAFAAESWQAAAWMLERRRPQDFGKMSRHEFSGPEGGPIRQKHEVDVKQLTDAELEAIIRAGGGELPVSAVGNLSDALAIELAS